MKRSSDLKLQDPIISHLQKGDFQFKVINRLEVKGCKKNANSNCSWSGYTNIKQHRL